VHNTSKGAPQTPQGGPEASASLASP